MNIEERREYNKKWKEKHPDYHKTWVKNHPDIIEYGRKYKKEHAEEIRKKNEEYFENHKYSSSKKHNLYIENRDRLLEWIRNKRIENKDFREKDKERKRKYKSLHPEKQIADNRNRRARKKNGGGKITATEWKELLEICDNKCLCCGCQEEKLVLDHIFPLALGGSNTINNAQPLCKLCNGRKYTKCVDYRSENIRLFYRDRTLVIPVTSEEK